MVDFNRVHVFEVIDLKQKVGMLCSIANNWKNQFIA